MDSQDLRNLQEAYLEVYNEGKVAWHDPKNPNPSGYTPKEKSEAKRKQLGVDNPDAASFEKGGPGEKEYARHGNLAAAQEKMSKRGKQPKGKSHQFKKNPFWKKTEGQVKRTMFGTNVPKDKKGSYPSYPAESYDSVYEATGRDEMIAANIARARAPKPTTGGTVRTPGGPVSTPGGPVKTPTPGPVAQAPKPGGLLGSLDKMARDTAGEIGSRIGEREGRNRTGNLPVISDIGGAIGRNKGRQQGQQMYDKAKETVGGLLKQDYEFDNFDVILEYLVAEGYADTNENALVIMANMSEEWKQTILEYGGGGGAAPNAPNAVVNAVDKLGSMFQKVAPKKPVKKQTPDGFNPHQKFN